MKGYPKIVNNKIDYINLLNDENTRSRAIDDLENIFSLDDSYVEIHEESEGEEPKIRIVENPMPIYKRIGFESLDEVRDLIDTYAQY